MTEPRGPIGWANQQAEEREQQPARHTADTITDAALDELYAELDTLRARASRLATDWGYAFGRAEKAEAANARVRALADRLDVIASASFGTPLSSVDKATAATANLIREALAEPKELSP